MAFKTIRSRMQTAFALAVTLVTAAVGAGSIAVSYRNGEREVLERLRVTAGFKEARINAWVHDLPADLSILVNRRDLQEAMVRLLSDPSVESARSDAGILLREQFRQFVRVTGKFEELFLVNLEGRISLSSDSGREGGFRGFQAYWKEGLKRPGAFVQTLVHSSSSESLNAIVVVQPVFDGAGRVKGILAGRAGMARLSEIVLDRTGLGDTGETYLVGSNGVLLTESRYAGYVPGGSYLNTPQINAAIVENASGAGLYRGYAHVPVYGVYRRLPELQAILVTEQGSDEALRESLATIERIATFTLASLLLTLLVGLPVVWRLARQPSTPVDHADRCACSAPDPHVGVGAAAASGPVLSPGEQREGMDRSDEPPLQPFSPADAAEEGEVDVFAESFGKMTSELKTLLAGLEEKMADAGLAGEKYRGIFENALEGIFQALPDGTIVEANPAMARIFGYEFPEELTAGGMLRGDAAGWGELLRLLEERGEIAGFQCWFMKKDGSTVWISLSARLTGKGDVRYIEGTAADITESREARELLATEKERLAVTLRSIGDGVISTDILGRVVLINRAAEELTGWAGREALGRPVEDIFCTLDEKTLESSESLVKKVLETGGFYAKEENVILVARDGERRYISNSGAPLRDSESGTIGVVLVFRDVTEKRKMEEDLLRTLKLDSLGTLAGGLAHDFNNILTAVLGNINLAAVLVSPDSKALPRLVEAEKATLRAKELTQQLLTFSKGGAPVRRTASIGDLLRESAEFALAGSNVRCEFCIQRDIWPAEVDVAQIGQVIHHLVVNASEAMPHGGIVRISADNARRDSGLPAALNPGNYVKISVEDSGMGISVEIAHKIFDPYFTTKERGTGLGLATSYSIVTKHDGLITVESVFGTGTTFTVYLPAFEGAVTMENGSKGGPVAAKGRILVMDDEEIVKEIIGEMLAHLGYEVEFAGDGEEAIELYRNALDSRARFDAVVMDLTIPGAMGGKEAIRKLQEMDSNVKAVVSSGYSNDPVMSHFREFGFSGVITKPFRIQELSEVMTDLFGGDRG